MEVKKNLKILKANGYEFEPYSSNFSPFSSTFNYGPIKDETRKMNRGRGFSARGFFPKRGRGYGYQY